MTLELGDLLKEFDELGRIMGWGRFDEDFRAGADLQTKLEDLGSLNA